MKYSIVNFSAMILCFWCIPEETEGETSFEKACLNRHNYYRKLHGVPPLQLDDSISQVSRNYANSLARRNAFEHSHNDNYGENLYSAWSSSSAYKISGATPVDSWYSEIQYYGDFGREPSPAVRSKTGHFTQVVWKGSRRLGVGVAKKSTSSGVKYIVVCNYAPPGNWIGQYKKNVPPPKK